LNKEPNEATYFAQRSISSFLIPIEFPVSLGRDVYVTSSRPASILGWTKGTKRGINESSNELDGSSILQSSKSETIDEEDVFVERTMGGDELSAGA
jgi:hypothetical protein